MNTTCNQLIDGHALIRDCIDGNRNSQYQLYDQYSKAMYSICLRYSSNPEDAQDILQNGFVKIFRSLSNLKAKESFQDWASLIFINTSIKHLRKRPKFSTNISDHSVLETQVLTNYDKFSAELLAAIQTLPNRCRIIINMFMIEGLSHKKISEMLNIPIEHSKSQLAIGKNILHQKIQAFTKTIN